MHERDMRKYYNIVAYPLAALVFVQFLNFFVHIGNVLTLIEVFTYAFIALYATKRFKMSYTETVTIAALVALLYALFAEAFQMYQGMGFALRPIVAQLLQAVITSFVVAFVTKRYMLAK